MAGTLLFVLLQRPPLTRFSESASLNIEAVRTTVATAFIPS